VGHAEQILKGAGKRLSSGVVDNSAIANQHDLARQTVNHRKRMRSEQNHNASLREGGEHCRDNFRGNRVYALKRLIKQQQANAR